MIQIKPSLSNQFDIICENCNSENITIDLIWQGIHICQEIVCKKCDHHIIKTLPIGHDTYFPSKINMKTKIIEGDDRVYKWLSGPLMESVTNPKIDETVTIEFKQKKKFDEILIINCIDYLYGHSLLKLLNTDRENNARNLNTGIVVLIQKPFEWMVPDYIDEVWVVNLPFSKARNYYKQIHEKISTRLNDYQKISLSNSFAHPNNFELENYIKVKNSTEDKRITFIWREDRIWNDNFYVSKIIQKYPQTKKIFSPYIYIQRNKVIKLFKKLREKLDKDFTFTVVGLGNKTSFPNWVDDLRTTTFNKEFEFKISQIYKESEVIIGVHGSNMLIPSGLSKMTVNLMPLDRWGNFSQDIIYQDKNPRISSYKIRYIPIETSINILSKIIHQQISGYDHFHMQMTEDLKKETSENPLFQIKE